MVYIAELDAIMRPSIVTGGKFEEQTAYCLRQSTDLFSAPRLFHFSGPLMGGPPTILRDMNELDALVRQARIEARLKACANLSRRPPLPSPLAKELDNTESTGGYLTGTTESTGEYFSGKSSLFSEPTATTSSVVSHNTGSRFRRCTPVSSATGTITVTTTSEPTTTSNSVVSHNPPSRFRRCTPVSSATGTTTVTTTTTSRGSYSTRPSVRPDPVRQATLPPPPPPQPRVQKPRKTIEIDHLPGGKFPRIGKKLIYDTSPETMARTGEEDRSIWNWIKKWGTGFGEQGVSNSP